MRRFRSSIPNCDKGSMGCFPSPILWVTPHLQVLKFRRSLVETVPKSLRLSCGSGFWQENFRYLRTVIVGRRLLGLQFIPSNYISLLLTFQHQATSPLYIFTILRAVFLINSCLGLSLRLTSAPTPGTGHLPGFITSHSRSPEILARLPVGLRYG